jgi:hypothetical protein
LTAATRVRTVTVADETKARDHGEPTGDRRNAAEDGPEDRRSVNGNPPGDSSTGVGSTRFGFPDPS